MAVGFALETYQTTNFFGFDFLNRFSSIGRSFRTSYSNFTNCFSQIFSRYSSSSCARSSCGFDTVSFSHSIAPRVHTSSATSMAAQFVSDVKSTPNNTQYDTIWNSIDEAERKLVEGVDLTQTDKKGNPVYQIALAKDGQYHIYKNGKAVKKVKTGSNKLSKVKTNTLAEAGGRTDSYVVTQIAGGSYRNGCAGVSGVVGQSVLVENSVAGRQFYLSEGGKTASPLVVDFNQDGKVDAQAGIGVDINGDGKADGAASNGDKMLAMSDMNGNGTIDGTEVFGDQTVNPFTGQKINASNGFEALKEIAVSAERETGLDCFDGTNVDLNNLKSALAKKGLSLGFISGTNNTQLEGLSKVDKINVTDYKNTQQSGAVQHNQQGYGTASDGSNMKVDDVWFYV